MVDHPGLATNRIVGPQAAAQKQQLWAQLTIRLNACSSGATKTAEKWAKVWQDWRCDTKQKAARIMGHARGTGGGPSLKVTALTPLEETLLGLLGQVAVEGHLDVPDSMQVTRQLSDGIPDSHPPMQLPTPTEIETVTFPTTPPITPSTSSQFQPFTFIPQPVLDETTPAASPPPPQTSSRKRKRPVAHHTPPDQYEERLVKAAEERAAAATSMAETFKETAQVLCETLREVKTEFITYLRRQT
ncbi:uncharacterized protein LOC124158021 isoform X1 [Ischnura elegans]|uniref:uncharacterized protein LOC124158021 isoform X1 n=1 Tax=Ischnura elegans TaxID=197161 RepID=UPI001ED893FD|nr:uncharacterized protein LOC124158021 isoform X1 [Ischnura elegans]